MTKLGGRARYRINLPQLGALIVAGPFFWGLSVLASAAHGGAELTDATAWTSWSFSPEIVILTLLTVAVYLQGMRRRQKVKNPLPAWRHMLFLSGVAVVFLSLQSPIDPIAERLFWMHQVQHILLRMLGPMLIALSGPEGVLIAGLPNLVRQKGLAPLLSNRPVRATFRFLTRPPVAFLVFLASLYIWQVPLIHDAAVENAALHYLMHFTMLAAGLIFFWLLFDRRDPPQATSHRVRLLMLLGTIVSNILIGSLTTLKTVVLYAAYDIDGRLFSTPPLVDEASGGYVMWVPASMMCVIAILIVLHGWGKHEERVYQRHRSRWSSSNSAALEFPQTAEELRIKVKTANRATALALTAVYLTMLAGAFSVAIMVHMMA